MKMESRGGFMKRCFLLFLICMSCIVVFGCEKNRKNSAWMFLKSREMGLFFIGEKRLLKKA